MYRLVVAGSRDFDDYELLEKECIKMLRSKRPSEVEIVSGAARGADKLGERFANEKKCHLKLFPAEWNRQPNGKYDKSAGYRRNAEMAAYSDGCIVFWDGKSNGTKHMMDLAKRYELDLKVVRY